jgi:hypothetical protein
MVDKMKLICEIGHRKLELICGILTDLAFIMS